MAVIDSVAMSQWASLVSNNGVGPFETAAAEQAMETTFIGFLVKEMNLTGMGSVLTDETQMSGDSLLMSQMLQHILIGSGDGQ